MLTINNSSQAIKREFVHEYELLGRGDIAGFLVNWAETAVFYFSDGLPLGGSGIFEGKPAIYAFFSRLQTSLGAGIFQVIHCARRGDKAMIEWTYQAENSSTQTWWVTQLLYSPAGQVVEARCYTDTLDLRQKLEAAG